MDYSRGIVTSRDAWCYNASPTALASNVANMIEFYNLELDRFEEACIGLDRRARERATGEVLDHNPAKISWSVNLKNEIVRGNRQVFDKHAIVPSIYRPFTAQHLYFDRKLNERVLQLPRMFPRGGEENRAISIKGHWSGDGQIALMVGSIPCDQPDGGAQYFPRRILNKGAQNIASSNQHNLLQSLDDGAMQHSITDEGHAHFQAVYPGEPITKDDLFYYTYGVLHSPDYRDRYADNLSKELPRIPAVKGIGSFRAFVEAGRKLGDLHVGYESVEPYPVAIAQGDLRLAHIDNPEAFYRVEQMKFAGKRPKLDKTTVIYNANITMTGIPLDAYEYVVNGKPALEWVMERQCVKTDKASGIVNDANRYAIETVGDPAYPLLLFQRVITVSLETMKIVRSLPPLDIITPTEAAAPATAAAE
ncbi:type ISP restriction/modification enzyme [Sphingomonas panni]